MIIVLIILFSALVAGYEAIDRLLHPQPIQQLLWVTVAGVVGFLGNEAVAVFRIRIGRKINSAALIADGYHARTDGLTSLAVVAGALGVWLGFPLADPIIGLLITVAILGIVWQSAKAVLTRMLDGVEPDVLGEIRQAAGHVAGIRGLFEVRARWLGHRLVAELDVAVEGELISLREADKLASACEQELKGHIPALSSVRIRIRPFNEDAQNPTHERDDHGHGHHGAPEPVVVAGALAEGTLEIVDTPAGERFRFTTSLAVPDLEAEVAIHRVDGPEILPLTSVSGTTRLDSGKAPAEPHEFDAEVATPNRHAVRSAAISNARAARSRLRIISATLLYWKKPPASDQQHIRL